VDSIKSLKPAKPLAEEMLMLNDPEVQQAAAAFQLGLPRLPISGRSGELLGRGLGSSLEFQEYREYLPGDDIRHLDWAAYARTDALMVRLYREEISPRVEIFLDGSRSMNTRSPSVPDRPHAQKSVVAKQLTALIALLAAKLGGRPAIFPMGDDRPAPSWTIKELETLEAYPLVALRTLADFAADNQIPPGRRSIRIVLSDFLFPHDPELLIKQFGNNVSGLWVLQIMNQWESDPTPLGGRRLVDLETQLESDLVLEENVISEYRTRLHRLQELLGTSCRRKQAVFSTVIADAGLMAICANSLCRIGLLRPAKHQLAQIERESTE
jgi:hypothetical protein